MASMHQKLLQQIDLTVTQFLVMGLLWEKDAQTIKEMGAVLQLDSGTLTPTVKRLEKKALVVRVRSTQDERSNIIHLTDAGTALRQQALQLVEQFYAELSMPEKEIDSLKKSLDNWIKTQTSDS